MPCLRLKVLPILPVDCFFIPWIVHSDAMVSLLLLCSLPIRFDRASKIRSLALIMFCPCFHLGVEFRQIDWRLRLKIFLVNCSPCTFLGEELRIFTVPMPAACYRQVDASFDYVSILCSC